MSKDLVVLPGTFDECTTEGLDELSRRCEEYRRRGCRFAKWRCVFKISSPTPSHLALAEVANTLARYAAVSQVVSLLIFFLNSQAHIGFKTVGQSNE